MEEFDMMDDFNTGHGEDDVGAQGDANEYTIPHRYLDTEIEKIKLIACKSYVIEFYTRKTENLKSIRATHLPRDTLRLDGVIQHTNLERFVVKYEERGILKPGVHVLHHCEHLQHLSILNVENLHSSDIRALANLKDLKVLELGFCHRITERFAKQIFPMFQDLRKLRLQSHEEVVNYADCIMEGIYNLPKLNQLELINFTIRESLMEKISKCYNFRKLLIAPKCIGSGIVTFNLLLRSLMRAPPTLKSVTWIIEDLMKEKCEVAYPEVQLNMVELKYMACSMLSNLDVNFLTLPKKAFGKSKFME